LISFYKFGTVAQKIEDYTAAIGWYEKAIAVAAKFGKPQFFANEVKVIKKQIGDCKAKMASPKPREAARRRAQPSDTSPPRQQGYGRPWEAERPCSRGGLVGYLARSWPPSESYLLTYRTATPSR